LLADKGADTEIRAARRKREALAQVNPAWLAVR
jgi:hypothetical protein